MIKPMRQILFKAQRADGKGWVEGDYLKKYYIETGKWLHFINALIKTEKGNPYYTEKIEIIPETLCQFTGLKDKNGKKIFEGCIVEANNSSLDTVCLGLVCFENGTFILKNTSRQPIRYWSDGTHDWYSMEQYHSFELDIKGNIHDKTADNDSRGIY